MDPSTQRLALIAGGLGGVLLLVVGGWSMVGHRSTTVPVIQADTRPIRVKPENPGGMQVAGANEDIMSGDPDTNSGKLAPPPEVPEPQALRAPPRPPPAPRPVVAAPVPAPPPVPLAIAPAPKAAPAAIVPAMAKPAAAPDKHAAAVAPAAPTDRTTQAGKATLVQLAAVSSEEAAKTEWQRLEKRMPELLGHRQPAISRIARDGQALWRVRTGGFGDLAEATVFCERVRAKRAGCSVADF
jgi:SPOR domain